MSNRRKLHWIETKTRFDICFLYEYFRDLGHGMQCDMEVSKEIKNLGLKERFLSENETIDAVCEIGKKIWNECLRYYSCFRRPKIQIFTKYLIEHNFQMVLERIKDKFNPNFNVIDDCKL